MHLTQCDSLPPDDWLEMRRPRLSIEALYRSQSGRLARFFARRGAREDAPDLVQETFRRYLGVERDPADPVSSPEAYLTRVADNLLRERLRNAQEQGRARHVPIEDAPLPALDPEPQLEQRDALARAERILNELPPRARDIFLLHRLHGLSYAEIAARRGISTKAIEKQMAKALFALRDRRERD